MTLSKMLMSTKGMTSKDKTGKSGPNDLTPDLFQVVTTARAKIWLRKNAFPCGRTFCEIDAQLALGHRLVNTET